MRSSTRASAGSAVSNTSCACSCITAAERATLSRSSCGASARSCTAANSPAVPVGRYARAVPQAGGSRGWARFRRGGRAVWHVRRLRTPRFPPRSRRTPKATPRPPRTGAFRRPEGPSGPSGIRSGRPAAALGGRVSSPARSIGRPWTSLRPRPARRRGCRPKPPRLARRGRPLDPRPARRLGRWRARAGGRCPRPPPPGRPPGRPGRHGANTGACGGFGVPGGRLGPCGRRGGRGGGLLDPGASPPKCRGRSLGRPGRWSGVWTPRLPGSAGIRPIVARVAHGVPSRLSALLVR